MAHEELTILSSDELKLYVESWPVSTPKAVVCLIHGFGEHIGRYRHVINAINDADIAVMAMDIRGHGKSEGLKGHAPNLNALMQDIEELLKHARSTYLDLPMFIYGHSMGGNLVINYVLQDKSNELSGFVASSPWLQLAFEPPKWKVTMASAMRKILPRLRQPNGLDSSTLSKDQSVCNAYDQDPLVNNKISVSMFTTLSRSAEKARNTEEKVRIPGLVYHGTADKLIDFEASQSWADNQEKVEWIAWDGVYHEPHNDHEQEAVIAKLVAWLKSKV